MFFRLPIFKRRVRCKRVVSVTADPGLQVLWSSLIDKFYPERSDLKDYAVSWSRRRQKRTLASCNVRQRRINVARELQHPECSRWLEPILYHELCHAVLGDAIGRLNGKRPWHGPEFKKLEGRHQDITALRQWIKDGGWSNAVRRARIG